MEYAVLTYGSYDVPDDKYDISTKEEAMEILHEMVNEWCDDHDVDVLDTDYDEGDESFYYGKEEEGVCAIVIYEIPLIKNDVDQYLWKAKMEAEKANYASEDYKWTLQDCDVDIHITRIEEYIDKVMELVMDGWKYEEK